MGAPPPAADFASQGDTHVRTDAQMKFLYYPLTQYLSCYQQTCNICYNLVISVSVIFPAYLRQCIRDQLILCESKFILTVEIYH